MQNVATTVFREMLQTTKAVLRTIWGTEGMEGLSPPQFGVLINLRRHGPLSPSDLSHLLMVTQGNITGLIERLRRLGLLERRRSATDRRMLKIGLTPKGNETLDAILPVWEKTVTEAFKPLSQADLRTLGTLLKKLQTGLHSDTLPTPGEASSAPVRHAKAVKSSHRR